MIKASIIIAFVATGGIILYALINRNNKSRLYEIAKGRPAFDLNAFKKAAKLNHVSDQLIETVIKQLLVFIRISDFSFFADDDLRRLVKITDLEIQNVVTDVCIRLNLTPPEKSDLKKYQDRKGQITTVQDLIEFMVFWGKKG